MLTEDEAQFDNGSSTVKNEDQLSYCPPPDYSWLQGGRTSTQVPSRSTILLKYPLIQALPIDNQVTFMIHRLLRIYTQTEETVLIDTDQAKAYVINHTGLENSLIVEALKGIRVLRLSVVQPVQYDRFATIRFFCDSTTSRWLHFEVKKQEIGCEVVVSSDLIREVRLNEMITTLGVMWDTVIECATGTLAKVEYLSRSQQASLSAEWSSTLTTFSVYTHTLLDMFDLAVKKYPERIAVVRENLKLTYAQLDFEASQLANHLRSFGSDVVGLEKIVVLYLDKSEFTFIAILACFKVGSGYVPVDPTYPEARVEWILADTNARVVVTNKKYRNFQPFESLIQVEIESVPNRMYPDIRNWSVGLKGESLAYVIFTSGTSEGRPKGVLVEHRNVVNYISDMSVRNFGPDPGNSGEVILQLSNSVFDVAVDQMWLGLANGLTCVILPQTGWYDPERFYEYIQNHSVTHVSGTPSFLKHFHWNRIPTLRRLVVGGEKLSLETFKRLRGYGRYQLVSMFGPTECTVISAHYPLTEYTSCVGSPIANTAFYVLDSLKPIPVGAVGELLIGGTGVTRGYLNLPELTADTFISNPFGGPFPILFRTGDLVRRLGNGTVEFVGRKDNQIKVRGNRVELTEIEHVVSQFPQIEQAVVVARESKSGTGAVLFAYYVSPVRLDESVIQEFLCGILPEYMTPARIIRIDSIPLTITGKLDSCKLPDPTELSFTITEPYDTSGLTPLEVTLYKVWSNTVPFSNQLTAESNFFELGGDSLSALEIVSKLRHQSINISVQDIFEYKTIRLICANLPENQKSEIDDQLDTMVFDSELVNRLNVKGEIQAVFPATSLQQGFIYKYLHSPNDGSYIVQNLWQYHEPIDVERFKSAWFDAVKRYPALRLRFDWEYSQLIQIIGSEAKLDFRYFKLSQPIEDVVREDRREGYDLSMGPLFRVYLIQEGPELYSCLFSNHHAIIDGISTAILLAKVNHLYTGQVNTTVDQAYLQTQRYLQSRCNKKDLAWWKSYTSAHSYTKNTLIGLLKKCAKQPLDRVNEIIVPTKTSFILEPDKVVGIKRFASHSGFTLQSILQFAWHKVLSVYGTSRETVSGLTVTGRSAPITGIHQSVGPYVNTLPLFVHHVTNTDALEMIRQVQRTVQEILAREYISLPSLSSGEDRLFDNIFVYEKYSVGLPYGTTVFEKVDYPLVILVKEGQTEIRVELTFDSELFERDKIDRLVSTMEFILAQLSVTVPIPAGNLLLVTDNEARAICEQLRGPVAPFDWNCNLHHLFETRVAQSPHKVALVTETGSMTFAELNLVAVAISNQIVVKCRSNPIVPTFFDNVALLPGAIIGCFKAGAAYCPIDPSSPIDQIRFILKDISAYGNHSPLVILTMTKNRERLELVLTGVTLHVQVIDLDEVNHSETPVEPKPSTLPGDIAAIIYTSGTTGMPKAVVLKHSGLVNYCLEQVRCNFTNEDDLVLSLLGWAFDGLWCALGPGIFGNSATAAVSAETALDAEAILEFTNCRKVTHIVGNPLHLGQLSLQKIPSLKTILSAGSVMTGSDAEKLFSTNARLMNGYGPTEASVIVTWGDISTHDDVHIGRPLSNTSLYILSDDLQLVPAGAIGELYIGGVVVSTGYLNQPEETALVFVPNRFEPQSSNVLYRTGDLVLLRPDGQLEYHGRTDLQVKVRGYRVNCAEIETLIASQPEVDFAVVSLLNHRLVAFVVPSTNLNLDVNRVLECLEGRLPDYMVPSRILLVDRIPLTSNGKVDYTKLRLHAEKVQTTPTPSSVINPQVTFLEQQIASVWSEVLRLSEGSFGMTDNYFRLGGDSITAIQIVSRFRTRLGIELRVADLFRSKTIRKLALLVESSSEAAIPSKVLAESGLLTGCVPFLPIQQWFIDRHLGSEWANHFNQAFMLKVPSLDLCRLQESVNFLNSFHDSLRLRLKYNGDQVIQYYSNSGPPTVQILSPTEIVANPEILSELQAHFDLQDGPVWSVCYIQECGDESARLHFAFHHMVIDSVSWRLLIDHLFEVFHGKVIEHKGTSYRQWVETLHRFYNKADIHEGEIAFWQNLLSKCPLASAYVLPNVGRLTSTKVRMSKEKSFDLIHNTATAYNTTTVDLLLTALAQVLDAQYGQTANFVTIEGHGRQEDVVDLHNKRVIDLSRTSGWFTSVYPIQIYAGNLHNSIVLNKEALRAVPRHGIGYGHLIGYGTPELPSVMFNFLGTFDDPSDIWNLTDDYVGITETNRVTDVAGWLTLDVSIVQAKVNLEVSGTLQKCELEEFASKYIETLEKIIVHAVRLGRTYLTPSDIKHIVKQDVLAKIQSRSEVQAVLKASSVQVGFIYYYLTHPNPPYAYHVQHMWTYETKIRVDSLRQAWEGVQAQFPALRLRFDWESELVQIIDKRQRLRFHFQDLCHLSVVDSEKVISHILETDSCDRFKLDEGPLFRVYLVKVGPSKFTSIFTHHHAILDGWSLNLVYSSLHATYLDRAASLTVDLAYVSAQAYLQSHCEQHLQWWQVYLSQVDENCVLHGLLGVSKRQEVQATKTLLLDLPPQLVETLRTTGASAGITLNVIFLYAWHKVLSIYSSCLQTIVGTTVSGRNLAVEGIETSVGCFINTLPTVVIHKSGAISEALVTLQKDLLELSAKSAVHLSNLVHLKNNSKEERLFDSIFVYENYPKKSQYQLELEAHAQLGIHSGETREQQEFSLAVLVEDTSVISCSVTYDTSIYADAQLHRLVTTFENILKAVATNSDVAVSELEYTDAQEMALLDHWNATECPFDDRMLVQDMLKRWVIATPSGVALRTELGSQTFASLWTRVERLAKELRHVVDFDNVGDMFIPFYLTEPSLLLETIFGILQAGGAYVPLDPSFTAVRMRNILSHLKPQVLLSVSSLRSFVSKMLSGLELSCGIKVIYLDVIDWNSESNSDMTLQKRLSTDPAYLLFTSGSTGIPKGVVIEHRSLVNTMIEMGKLMTTGQITEVVLPLFGWGFDAIWSAIAVGMLTGGTTVLANPSTILDTPRLIGFCCQAGVTQLHGNPLLVEQIPVEHISSLRIVCVAGQAIGNRFLNEFGKRCPSLLLINGYGPTETSVGCTLDKIQSDEASIGKCIGNMTAYVLDHFGVRVPIGVRGQLCIGGPGVGRGYFGDELQTNQLFISNPFGTGRLYRSGDIVQWTEGGKLTYIGRQDLQVKIRGFRVDLGEIEKAAESCTGINRSVVLLDSRSKLVCYAVPNSGMPCPSKQAIYGWLERILPEYMIPSGLCFLARLPLTANGKLDAAKLPPIDEYLHEHIPPRTPLETQLCTVWSAVLNSKVGISDNFFRLGGDSISSIEIVGQLRSQLGDSFKVTVQDILSHKTIQALVNNLPYTPRQKLHEVLPAKEGFVQGKWVCEGNSLQQGLVYHYKAKGRYADAYVVQKVIHYGEVIDLPRMKAAWEKALRRYPGLRVKFCWTKNKIEQVIEEEPEPIAWRLATVSDELEFGQLLGVDRSEGFDLGNDTLLRLTFIQLPGGQRCLVTVHHAVSDGWSIGLLLACVHSTYVDSVAGKLLRPAEPDLAYMNAQRYLESTQDLYLGYWQEILNSCDLTPASWSSLSPETYGVAPTLWVNTVHTEKMTLDSNFVEKILKVAASCEVTPNALFQLAWHRTLRVFGHTDITIVGTTFSGRDLPIDGIHASVGLFVNTLPMVMCHAELDQMQGTEAVKLIQERTMELNSKANVKLSKLKDLRFDTIYAFENYPISNESRAIDKSLKISYTEGISYEDYPLLLTVSLKGSECSLELQSSSGFLAEATSRLLSTVQAVVENIVRNIHATVNSWGYLPQSEISRIIASNTLPIPACHHTVIDKFREVVQACPDRTAVVYQDRSWTYAQLDGLSDKLADRLLRLGPNLVGRDRLVPIFLPKGPWTHVGILGVLKTGSAYVPIDEIFPDNRISSIVRDISAEVIVTSKDVEDRVPGLQKVFVDELESNKLVESVLAHAPCPGNLAYAIYTSGTSTGKPKGCLIEHRNLVNYLEDTSSRVFGGVRVKGQGRMAVLLQLANTSFDPSVDQIFVALYNGFTSVIPPNDLWMDSDLFVNYCTRQGVTDIFGTPSMLKLFELKKIPSLRTVRIAGERISLEAYNKLRPVGPNCYVLANVCGPTETTVTCTYKKLTSFTYSVGPPIANVTFVVMDTTGQHFVPVGTIGEVYIGGAGVGRGYLNQPELNARHFFPNPWTGVGTVYRSGDLVRRLHLDEMEFIGRTDSQVKVRGFRVDLSEVESKLRSYPAITDGVVALKELNGNKVLVAYYISTVQVSTPELSDYLSLTLANYMVPTGYVRLDRIPLTTNGKLDLIALPIPLLDFEHLPEKPSSELERAVAAVWAEIFKVDPSTISISDNFFSLGGDSITAMLITEKLKLIFGSSCRATVKDLLHYKTIKMLVNNCFEGALHIPPTVRPKVSGNSICSLQKDDKIQWVGFANSLQQGFVAHYLSREAGDDSYVVQVLWKYANEIHMKKLHLAWEFVWTRSPGLRVRFDWSSTYGVLLQIVDHAHLAKLDWRALDWTCLTSREVELTLEKLRLEDRSEHFDLAKGQLIRVYLIKVSPTSYFCLSSNHHSILDGWSASILFSSIHLAYVQLLEGVDVEVQEDSAYFTAQEVISAQSELQTKFWQATMQLHDEQANFLSLTQLAGHELDLSRFTKSVLDLSSFSTQLHKLSVQLGLTLNTLLQFSWHKVLSIFLRMSKTVVGTTVSGRMGSTPGIDKSVGLYINTLPMIVDHTELDQMTLISGLESVQAGIIELCLNSAGKLGSLRKCSQASGSRPFESLFIFENFPDQGLFEWQTKMGVSQMEVFEKLDFPIVVSPRVGGQRCIEVTVLTSVSFEPSGVVSMLTTFRHLISSLIESLSTNPVVLVKTLTFCTDELDGVTCESNSHLTPTLVVVFRNTVSQYSQKVALITELRCYTYAELDRLSNSLAAQILKVGANSVGPNKLVALFLTKSVWTVVGILAVLKTGSAYVPIDTDYPDARVRGILQNCGASVVVTQETEVCAKLGINVKEISVESISFENQIDPSTLTGYSSNNLAYCIYTSGTTSEGTKGCLIEHHSVVNLLQSLSHQYSQGSMTSEVILLLSSYVYDLSVLQMWLALKDGGTILMPSKSTLQNVEEITSFMAQHHVTHVSGTPSFLKLIKWQKVPSLRRLCVGGELFIKEAWDTISSSGSASFRIINEYGLTETTVTSSYHEMTTYSKTIGKPIDNTWFYIANENLTFLPDHVLGELLIGGEGLARGYQNREGLNSKTFVRIKGQTLFRTGDIARRKSNGDFEILGRNDTQVKIRGQRVELEEIARAIRDVAEVEDAIVVLREAGLVAYYVAKTDMGKLLRDKLLQSLPSFCVPMDFILLDTIPLGITGKVDVQALPAPLRFNGEDKRFPSTELEQGIAEIWSQILKCSSAEIGIDDDFFLLGGDSLLMIQMMSKVRELTGVNIKVSEAYREKTIRRMVLSLILTREELHDSLEDGVGNQHPVRSYKLEDYPEFELFEEIDGVDERIFMFPPGLGGVTSYMGNLVPMLKPRRLVLFNNFYEFLKTQLGLRIPYEEVAREYITAMIRLQPNGPYHLIGWSWGGVLAFEIARQLATSGKLVGKVFIIDSLFCMRSVLSPDDSARLRKEQDVSYRYEPASTPELSSVHFVLFKATQVNGVGFNGNQEDNELDGRIYSYYVNNTKANYLNKVLPSETTLEVIPFESNHFQWYEDLGSVNLIGSTILAIL